MNVLVNRREPVVRDFDQRTDAWHAWRANGIGGSDIAAIIGLSPFQTARQFHEERLGLRERRENPLMRRGADLEPLARIAFEEQHGSDFPPACLEHPEFPVLRASLDGWRWTEGVLEILIPGRSTYVAVARGEIPVYKYAQVQYQLAIAGEDLGRVWVWHPRYGGIAVEVERDDAYAEALLERALEAWERIRTRSLPAPGKGDMITREDRRWTVAARSWLAAEAAEARAKARKDVARGRLLAARGHSKERGGGVMVYESAAGTSTDWEGYAGALDALLSARGVTDRPTMAHYQRPRAASITVKRDPKQTKEIPE